MINFCSFFFFFLFFLGHFFTRSSSLWLVRLNIDEYCLLSSVNFANSLSSTLELATNFRIDFGFFCLDRIPKNNIIGEMKMHAIFEMPKAVIFDVVE